MMSEYQSREFCRDTICHQQIDLDYLKNVDSRPKSIIESEIKYIKDEYCQHCKAYQFHQWLKENGYKIMKGK